jgi:hypothetical protein
MQSVTEQKINIVLNVYMCRDCPTIELQGNSRGTLHASQGVMSQSSPLKSDGSWESKSGRLSKWMVAKVTWRGPSGPLRSDISCDGQAGMLDRHEAVAKDTQSKLNLNGNYQTRVHPGQMFLVVARQGGWIDLTVAENSKMRVGKKLWAAKGPT